MMKNGYRRKPEVLTEDKIAQLCLSEIRKPVIYQGLYSRFACFRNAAMFLFGFYLGLRPKEIYNARIEDLDLATKTFYIRGENNKLRQQDKQSISDRAIPLLVKYLHARGLLFANSPYLFPAYQTKHNLGRLSRSTFDTIFRNAIKRLGWYKVNYIDKQGLKHGNLNPYTLRHSYGTAVFNKTKDLRKTQACMRHRYISSTLKYIHIDDEKLRIESLKEVFA